ncbi:MAG: type I-U CRISPR-associated protein Cas5/Cas6, partial [Magnetococcales bacterium]|nr:type I-U CRISPR-associated protein Cas5/Cas6 [Magnetococcales bacterium]
MLAISFRFPGKRYHATPWGRHVNEADVAWPPEPWRILRSLVAVWYRKGYDSSHAPEVLASLIHALAEELPVYQLPMAVLSHSRHYMPDGAKGTSLVFDAFTRMEEDASLVVAWPQLVLTEDQRTLLAALVTDMGYLGRAESWVEGELLPDWQGEKNCFPEGVGEMPQGDWQPVTVLAPVTSQEYTAWREGYLDALQTQGMNKREMGKVTQTLPTSLLAALSLDTGELRKAGWSRPPGAKKVVYLRHSHCFQPSYSNRTISTGSTPPTLARFSLMGRPLPLLEDSVRIGELFRLALMGISRRHYGENAIPVIFSGHDLPEDNRHGHAFYLPEDADQDGHIDHLLLSVPMGLDEKARQILGKLQEIRGKDTTWTVLLEGILQEPTRLSPLLGKTDQWLSITPYLHPWHAKKGFWIEEQLQRECQLRGLPPLLAMERLPAIQVNGRERRTLHFHRFRNKRGLVQPDSQGGFWKLTFAQPIEGPL